MSESQQLTVHDLHDMLKELWRAHKNTKPTMTIWVDGWYEDGEPDTDDAPLKVGDLVQLSYARIDMLEKGLDGRRPWIFGKVERFDPWHEDLEGKVCVRLSNGNGAWWERAYFRKVSA